MFLSSRKASTLILFLFLTGFVANLSCRSSHGIKRVLVFSKTAGFRHIDAIEAGIEALKKMGDQKGFLVDTTEDAAKFNEENLARYNAVLFLNASGEVFTAPQREAFQRYIQAGGGFLAIHGPTDAEREWPWYGNLIGAYFRSHPSSPNVQKGTYEVVEKTHPATDSLPQRFDREDEFYDFDMVSRDLNVLVTIDEKTYNGGKTGDHHPAVWYHEYDGGRSFYTAMGHTIASYSDPIFLKIVWGGLFYVMGGDKPVKLDYSRSVPEENRFEKVVLMEKLDEPMQLAIAGDGKLFFAQRRGEIMAYDPATKKSELIGSVPVSAKYEDGLLGIALDPAFSINRQLYVFYSAPGGLAFHISRFSIAENGKLDVGSEKNLLKIPKDILDGSHTGGGLLFDPGGSGNLYITVGDNSSPRVWKYAPIDERKGHEHWDAQRSSANTNDLRGKILRIHPEPDGSYTIPAGNLFPKGMNNTRPEIYSMGHRQPWRISIDSKTGWLYEGEVGPDANDDSTGLGSKGYDEFNQIREAGNFGWPYFIADNKAYWKYDFSTGKSGERFNPEKPVNTSVNSTGIHELPPARKAFIWYPYSNSPEFPLMGSGSRSATGGPVFRQADFKNAKNTFPSYYEGKWFIADWIRGWINVVSMDAQGNYQSMERFMPDYTFSNPIDLQFGPDGSMYMLEYGKGWFRANDDARLVKIVYNSGNRAPVIKMSAPQKAGAVPLAVKLSGAGTTDADGDALTYSWKVYSPAGETVFSSAETAPSLVLDKPGAYKALLTVTDDRGASAIDSLGLVAGNEPPEITLHITKGNSSFFFPGNVIGYRVSVTDKEDGSSGETAVNGRPVRVSVDYVDAGITQLLGDPDPAAPILTNNAISLFGGMVLNSSDCYSCHSIDKKSAGPSFKQVAEKYANDPGAAARLVQKVIAGGSGNWGQTVMSAHPDLEPEKAEKMINFILSLSKTDRPSLPLTGSYTLNLPATAKLPGGAFVISASYTDSGRAGLPPQTAGKRVVLRSAVVTPASADRFHDVMKLKIPGRSTELVLQYGPSSWFAFNGIDLTGIKGIAMDMSAAKEGILEIRIDSPQGAVIAESPLISPMEKGAKKEPIRIPVNNVNGKHDLFFNAKSPGVKTSDIVFSVSGIQFLDR